VGDDVTVVLVHGAWHGAWCWERVVPGLADRGVEVTAIDLPGHGDDPGSLTDLHGDAQRVREVLDAGTGPVLLVGHSYGGAVISEAGGHDRVRELVFLAALPLDADETCLSAATSDPATAAISHEGRPTLGAALAVADDGTSSVKPELAAELFYGDCDDATAAWAIARLGPHRLDAMQQQPAAVAWRTKPSTYAVCADDLAIHPDLQRVLSKRCATAVEWPASHSPFLSRPELVVDLLAEVAGRVRSAAER
jgi:pimeloyl-ACP methyl ester carboxylesterase